MENYNAEYKKQNMRIGTVMLFFLGASTAFSLILVFLETAKSWFQSEKAYDISYQIIYCVVYFAMFFVPMLLYKKFDKKYSFRQMPCRLKFSSKLPLLIFSGLALNFVAAYINSILMSLAGVDLSGLMVEEYPNGYQIYHFILDIIKIAIVPAFCEELLFRGLILDRLTRFGRFKAMIISALLFALMHQNPAQIFYTFILGMFLAYMALESGSIWGCIILHFVNNLSNVIFSAIQYTQSEARATFIIAAIELAILLIGLAATIYYFAKYGMKHLNDGEWMYQTDKPLSKGYAVKGFFTPTMIVFVAVSGASAVMLFLL
ncbi:MAG: CPBP family intramembrane metalloprotease [Ruminococcaceae bacterium]|nr:CPBP family intramembrane metalloprotease [Oscillospiraceae bacterium]